MDALVTAKFTLGSELWPILSNIDRRHHPTLFPRCR